MKPIILALAAAFAVPAPLLATSVRAQEQVSAPQADAALRAPLEAYLRGHATGDPAAFREAFHPEAVLWGIRADGRLARMTAEQYIGGASGSPAADEDRRKRSIDSIEVNGEMATARITLDYPTVRFVDVMTLIRIEGRWWIINKMFQAHPPTAAAT
ncbi:MAG TPA: nuclear transport factor 2 family protein [Brevundimonas sp.]